MKKTIALMLIILGNLAFSQSMLDELLTEENKKPTYELNGYIRSGIYAGKNPINDKLHSKSAYVESILKLKVDKLNFGNAFADIRFHKDLLEKDSKVEVELNESYLNIYIGNFDFRIGQQIVVWGKADGYNPTNNITPMHMFVFSPDEDDRRKGNFLLRSFYNFDAFRLETIWIPSYKASAFPFDKLNFPETVTISAANDPSEDFSETSVAIKLHYEHPSIDGTLSYFNGYRPLAGLSATFTSENKAKVFASPYRTHIIGADFSTTAGAYGLRGEFSFAFPFEDKNNLESIPGKQLEYIVGIDFERGDWSFIFQYVGKYNPDYEEENEPVPPGFTEKMESNIRTINRMIFGSTDEVLHSVSFRPLVNLLNETLSIELLGQVNLTTEEMMLKPKLIYDITDDLEMTFGAQIFCGDGGTFYDKISTGSTAMFFELKASF